jgi:hypothetical protein
VLHFLPHIIIALIVLGAFVTVWRAEGDDDPLWQARWAALPPTERARIAAAARSGDLLASQDDIELAAGFARRDLRRRRPGRLISAIDVPIGILLILGGLVTHVLAFSIFGAAFLLIGLFRLARSRQIGRGLRETISRDHMNGIE